jgi:two-component system chemotaxis response regulator CheB
MRQDIVVLGASSGGLQVLQTIVGSLPQNLPASIFIVVHIAGYQSVTSEL